MVIYTPNKHAQPLLDLLRRAEAQTDAEREAFSYVASQINAEMRAAPYQLWQREHFKGSQ